MGLASISILLSACVSIKDGPGFRKNVDLNPFQRSAAVKGLDDKTVNLELPVLKPLKKSKKFKTSSTSVDSFASASSSSALLDASNSTAVAKASAGKDMELVLGNHQYYRTDVERPS
ncbi:MAG TPA: hypothetical protein PLM98_05145, partial [Thiolinea sp.]|nr:hypothetical protein [Thiolinea sp.]